MTRISGIYRYPIKGFGAQRLQEVALSPGAGVPFDRFLGVAHGGIDIAPEGWTTYNAFVRLAKNPRLLGFGIAFEDDSTRITLSDRAGHTATAQLDAPEEMAALNQQLAQWFPDTPAPPRLARRHADLGWWDCADSPISLINTASALSLEPKAGQAVDPIRFRGNLYLEDLPAWEEFAYIGHRLRIGAAELEVLRPMERCSATSADPETGLAGLNVPALLGRAEGHLFCGLYAQVVRAGRVRAGDRVEVLAPDPRIWQLGAVYAEAPPVPKWPRPAEVIETRAESVDVTSLWLRDPAAGTRGALLPGQHVRVHLGGAEAVPLWRSYTVSGLRDGLLRLSVKAQGRVSTRLSALAPGETVVISGPYGEFTLPEEVDRPLVFISAGIGITPMAAMLEAAEDRAVHVLHTARSGSRLALWSEIRAQAPDARLFLTQPGADAPAYEAGRIPDTALSALPLAEAVCFLCGPVPFMEEMRARLLALGAQDIRHEVFATPADTPLEMRPIPEPGPFRVSFGAGESTWQAGDGTLLEFGEGAGVKLSSNCRSGVCGACKVKLRSGAVAHLLDAPFPLAPDDVLTCCAVPLGDVRLEA
jgi:ferredoxin-NADP reductase/uncharacterized protein YcbX